SPEAERIEVVRFVADLTGGNLEGWASQACRIYPASWIRELVVRKVVGSKATLGAPYLNSILQSWARAGACEYLAADPPAIVPIRPTAGAAAFARPESPGAAKLREQRERNRRLIEEAEAKERAEDMHQHPRSEPQR